MSYDLLNHPDVLKTIRFELLRGGYPQHEVDDGIREVVEEVFAYLKTQPEPITTVDRMKAVVRKPSYRRGIDRVRAEITKREAVAKIADQTASRNAQQPSLEERTHLRGALDVVEQGKQGRDAEILQGIANEETDRETAARMGRKEEQVRQDTATMRKRARFNLTRAGYGLGIVGAIAGIAIILIWLRWRANDEAHRQPAPPPPSETTRPEPPPQVPVTMHGPSEADKKKAAELRAHAHAAALAKNWSECVKGYEAANGLDPNGGDKIEHDDVQKCALEMMDRSKP
jgi:hypothetical protein